MTQAEKMAREYGSRMCRIPDQLGVVNMCEDLIRIVAERTREEILKLNAKGIDEDTGKMWESDIIHARDVRAAKWEDEEWQ